MSGSNGNGRRHNKALPTGGSGLPVIAIPAFVPKPNDWAVFDAFWALRTERKPVSMRNMAHLAGITHQAISLKFANPAFGFWWQAAMAQVQIRFWQEAKAAQLHRAADDLEAFKVLLPLMEPQVAQPPAAGQQQAQQQAFVVNIKT